MFVLSGSVTLSVNSYSCYLSVDILDKKKNRLQNMNRVKEHIPADFSLGVYAVVGAILRYFITFPCGSEFENTHIQVGYYAIIFIIIGIGFGLYSFIFPNRNKNRVAHGIVTGLGVGFGGMTVYVLLNPCI